MAHDIVYRSATVYDGTGSAPITADVALEGERIVEVGDVTGASRRRRERPGTHTGLHRRAHA